MSESPFEDHHRLLVEAAPEAIIVADWEGRVVQWNPAAVRMFGYSRTEALGIPIVNLIPERYRERHNQAMKRIVVGSEPRLAPRAQRFEALRRDGSEFPMEISLSSFLFEGRRFSSAHIRDATADAQAEERQGTQFALTEAIAESQSLMEALPKIGKVICRNHGWSVGAAWKVSPRRDNLECQFFWGAVAGEVELWRHSAADESIRGTAWRTARPQWISDLASDGSFPGNAVARNHGFRSALAFPVMTEGEVAGVLEFYSSKARTPEPELMQMVAYVGQQIGVLARRGYAYEAVAHTVQQMQIGLFIFSLEDLQSGPLKLVSWNPAGARLLQKPDSALNNTSVGDLFCGDRTDALTKSFEETIRTQKPDEFANVHCQSLDGKPLVLDIHTFPLANSSVAVTFEDVTARSRAEELLASERDLLSLVLRVVTESTFTRIATHCAHFHSDGRLAVIVLSEGPRFFCSEKLAGVTLSGGAIDFLNNSVFTRLLLTDLSTSQRLFVSIPVDHADMPEPFRRELRASGIASCRAQPFYSPAGEFRGAVLLYEGEDTDGDPRDERVLQLYGHVSSIAAERLDYDQALRLSERRFRTLTLATTQAIWRTSASGQVEEDLPSWRAITGQTVAEILGDGWLNAAHPDDRAQAEASWKLAVAEKSTYQNVVRFLTSSGGYRDFAVKGVPLIENGEVLEWTGSANDITERLQAERELRESENRLALIVEATTHVVRDWDLSVNRIWWSEGFRSRFGYPFVATLAETWTDNIHPDDRDRVVKGIHLVIDRRDRDWSDHYRFRHFNGSYLHVTDRGMVFFSSAGEPIRMVGAMLDVTEHNLLVTQLEQMKRVSSLGRLAATMAHEFNNVLMGIQPFTEVIRRLTPEQPRIQDSTGRILQSIQRGRKITDEILRFTRRIEPVIKRIDVREWLKEFRQEAEALASSVLIIKMELPPAGMFAMGDLAQLQQVLVNLLLNAKDASTPGSELLICAQWATGDTSGSLTGSDSIHVSVQDFGSGMDPATLDQIFDPLFTTKRGGHGARARHQPPGHHQAWREALRGEHTWEGHDVPYPVAQYKHSACRNCAGNPGRTAASQHSHHRR